MLCRFWIGNNRHRTVRMVKQPRDDWTKHPPAECTPAAAHHDHLGIVRCVDKRRHYAVVHALGVNVRPLLTGQFLDNLSCLLQDLTRLEFLALCNGVVGSHRRADERRGNNVYEFDWQHMHHGLTCRPANGGVRCG